MSVFRKKETSDETFFLLSGCAAHSAEVQTLTRGKSLRLLNLIIGSLIGKSFVIAEVPGAVSDALCKEQIWLIRSKRPSWAVLLKISTVFNNL